MNYLALALFCLWILTEVLSGRNAVSEGLADQITEYGEAMASDFPIARDPGDSES